MIQYDRNMSSEDLVAYWLGGYVIMRNQKTGRYVLAAVRKATRDSVVVGDVEGGGDETMTRDRFFREVILHRPQVNLVEYGGTIYRLTWAAPDRSVHKHISHDMLRAAMIAPKGVLDPKQLHLYEEWQEGFLDQLVSSPETRLRGLPLGPWPAYETVQRHTLTLLLHSMNNPITDSIGTILRRMHDAPIGTLKLLSRDEYAHKISPTLIELHVGEVKVGAVMLKSRAKSGKWEFAPAPGIDKKSCWWDYTVRLASELRSNSI